MTGDVESRSTTHQVSSCVQERYQKSRQWDSWGSLVQVVNGGVHTTTVCKMIPGFSPPFSLMESSLDRVESNGSRSAAVDIACGWTLAEGIENCSGLGGVSSFQE